MREREPGGFKVRVCMCTLESGNIREGKGEDVLGVVKLWRDDLEGMICKVGVAVWRVGEKSLVMRGELDEDLGWS